MFTNSVNWIDIMDMLPITLRRHQLHLGMYALHLHTGNSLFAKRIKLDMSKGYIRAVGSFASIFDSQGTAPRYDKHGDQNMSNILTKIFEVIKKYEEVPHR